MNKITNEIGKFIQSNGGELHQQASGTDDSLTTNHGVVVSDDTFDLSFVTLRSRSRAIALSLATTQRRRPSIARSGRMQSQS